MGHYLFGFSGRINRAKIWLFVLIVLIFHIVAVAVVVGTLGPQNIANVIMQKAPITTLTANNAARSVGAIIGLLHIVLIVAGLAVVTKRLHDRNKSAWWLLVFYALPFALNLPRTMILLHALADGTLFKIARHGGVEALGGPVVTLLSGAATLIAIWAFVELYCFRGTVGDNRYGADPLAGRG